MINEELSTELSLTRPIPSRLADVLRGSGCAPRNSSESVVEAVRPKVLSFGDVMIRVPSGLRQRKLRLPITDPYSIHLSTGYYWNRRPS